MNNLLYPNVLQTAIYNAPIGTDCDENPKKFNRKNPWGNRSYADLITQAIESSPEKRLTLSQIYDWLIRNVSYFNDKGENNSSAGWKNSIRHNLSLHKKFYRIKNDGIGKSSWWTVNPAAGSGRVPRRKTSYRRRRGKPLIAHRQLGSLPSLFRNNRCGIHSKGFIQRNTWSGRAPWNALKPANEPLQTAFQSTTSVNTSTFNTNILKPINSKMAMVDALRAKSCKSGFYLRPLNQIHTESIFTTQTLSLRETKSCGDFKHELDVFQQTSSFQQRAVIPNKTLSTEYFSIPHHLSGSYITEVEIEKFSDLTETTTNNFGNSIQFYTEQPPNVNTSNDLESKEFDFILSSSNQHDLSNFQAVLEELRSDVSKCDSFSSCNSVISGMRSSNNSSVIEEENSTDSNTTIGNSISTEKWFGDTLLQKVCSQNLITSDSQKHDSYAFNMEPKKVPFSLDSDFGFDTSANLEITPEKSDSHCIEKIIERLNSPKSEHLCSDEEANEDDVCNFIENQLAIEKSPKLFNDKSTNICFSTNKQDPTRDSNFLMTSSPSEYQEYNTISSDTILNGCNNVIVNEHEYFNSGEITQFVSDEPAQCNLESNFTSYFNVSKHGEISNEEQIPSYKKDTYISNLINNKSEHLSEFNHNTCNVVSKSKHSLNNNEMSDSRQTECAKLSVNDDLTYTDKAKRHNKISNFIQDSFRSVENATDYQHSREEFPQNQNVDLSTDLEVLTLNTQETHKIMNEDLLVDYQSFDNKATELMISGLDSNSLMDEEETTDSFLFKHLSELSNMTLDDNLNDFFENGNNTSVIEDYFLHCLKDDVMLDELLNYENLYDLAHLGENKYI